MRVQSLWSWCIWLSLASTPTSHAQDRLLGIGLHAAQEKTNVAAAMAIMSAASITSFRDELYWSHVERTSGSLTIGPSQKSVDNLFLSSTTRGLQGLVVLGYGNKNYGGGLPLTEEYVKAYARYCSFVATRYAGRVPFFEIWNEWNGGMGSNTTPRTKGLPADYVPLARACAQEIRKNAPQAKILVGSTAGYDRNWTDAVLKAGVMEFADGFSVHPYVFENRAGNDPERAVGYIKALATQLRGQKKRDIYITEMGWPTNNGRFGVSEEAASAYISRFLLGIMEVPEVRGVWVYELIDGGTNSKDKEHHFGIVRSDLSAKPSFHTIKAVASIFKKGKFIRSDYISGRVKRFVIETDEGRHVSAFWKEGDINLPNLIGGHLAPSNTTAAASIRQPESGVFPISAQDIGPTPVLIEHDAQVEIEYFPR